MAEQEPRIDRYDDEGDYTNAGGEKGPGVTRVLRKLFEIPGMDTDFYLERGTIVHDGTVQMEEDRLSWEAVRDLYPHCEPFLRGYGKFLKETGWQTTLREKKVFSKRYMYGATLDRFGKMGHHMIKRWTVLEIKTGDSKLNPAVAFQLAGQLQALKESHPEVLRGKHINRASVQLHSNGRYDLKWWDSPIDLSKFLAFNLVWQTLRDFKREW